MQPRVRPSWNLVSLMFLDENMSVGAQLVDDSASKIEEFFEIETRSSPN